MKKIYLFLFAILFSIAANAQWTQVGTAFTGAARGLYFSDENTGYAVGGNSANDSPQGYISHTSDGGVTWSNENISGPNLFRAVYFRNLDTGYVCGVYSNTTTLALKGYLVRTVDGGSSWETIFTDTSQYFRAVNFVSSTVGFLGSTLGKILKTTDGGTTWTTIQLDQSTSDVIQLRMVDETTGYAVCSAGVSPFANGYVYKTTDGGDTWTQVYYDATHGLLGLAVFDASTVYAGGLDQLIVKSSDGGATWSSVYSGIAGPTIRSGAAASGDDIFMVDDQGHILSSKDAGTTWNDTLPGPATWLCVNFPSPYVGYVSNSAGGVYKLTLPLPPPPPAWTLVGTPFAGFVRGLHFTSEDVGYAVGGDQSTTGYISKTTDGGVSWTTTSFTESNLIRSADFVTSDTGYACGAPGIVFKTTDSGATWSLLYTDANPLQYFRAIDFVSSQVGYIGGAAGTILKTTDGGTTWTTLTLSETTSDVIQLQMIDANTGYAVASTSGLVEGYVYKTTDGGDSWTQLYYDAAIGLLGLAIVDEQTVYAGGLNQAIIKTSDGGATWSTVYSNLSGVSIRAAAAPTASKIFMADASGYVTSTEDAGGTWSDTLVAASFFAMHFPTSSVGYIGDGVGNVYKIVLTCTPVGEISEISGSTSICNNQKYEYTIASVDGADSYEWTLPEGATIVAGEGTNDITVTFGENSGTVSVTASNTCSVSGTSSLDVTVNIAPPVPTITFDSGVLTSSAPSDNQWYYNSAIIPGATDQSYTATQNGSYYVVVTSADSCSSQSDTYEVIGVGTGNVNSELPLSMYPNPMNQFTQINISSPDASLITITDVQGKLIISIPVTSSQMVLSKNDLSDGMYMVQLLNSKNELISRLKLIVQ